MILALTMAASVALTCQLRTMDDDPPMIITLNEDSETVQVSMAGQTYFEDIVVDGPIVWWQVTSRDGTIIRSRLNKADGTLIITNESSRMKAKGQIVEGNCSAAQNTSRNGEAQSRWVKLGDTPRGTLFVDVDSARQHGPYINHWIKMMLPTRTKEGEDYIVIRQLLDCRSLSWRAQAIISYDLSGNVKERQDPIPPEETEWVFIAPDSTFSALEGLLCN